MTLLPTLLLLALAPDPGRVELGGTRFVGLRETARGPESTPAKPSARSRSITLRREQGHLVLVARWQLVADEPGWFFGELAGGALVTRRVTLDGHTAAAQGGAPNTVVAWVSGTHTLELVARIDGDPSHGALPITLLPATIGETTIAPELGLRLTADDGSIVRAAGQTLGGASALRLELAPPPAPPDDGTLALGQVGVGLVVGDAELGGRARLQWIVRRGALERVSFTARDVGADLAVEGPFVRKVDRDGDRVTVELQSPATSRVALELSWSAPTPRGDAAITPPSFVLDGTSRTDSSFELARDGDVDVVPTLAGWQATVAARLPDWGRDLAAGQSMAAFVRHGDASGKQSLQLLRFVPVEAPAIVVDRANLSLAAARSGQVLLSARYEVVNERASHLRLRLPAGARLLAVEIGGLDVRTARDGDTVLIPLKRSLETVTGLVATPVTVAALLPGARWRRRDVRTIALPAVEAPIRDVRARLLLPSETKATIALREAGVISIERAPRRKRVRQLVPRRPFQTRLNATATPGGAAPPATAPSLDDDLTVRQAKEDALLREAEEAYNDNDFDRAQTKLDELDAQGLGGENLRKLQSNLDVLNAPPAPPEPVAADAVVTGVETSSKVGVSRRIKDQARARATTLRIEARGRKDKAKKLRASGDYKAAEQEYRRAIEQSKQLDKLEQDESRTYEFEAADLEAELEATKSESAARERLESVNQQKLFAPPPAARSLRRGNGVELGLGAAALPWAPDDPAWTESLPADARAVDEGPQANFGPRVLVPLHGGEAILYAFDLWSPGSQHVLRVESRKRKRART